MAADTPPAEGTEGTPQGNGLFDDYVQGAPPELRPYAEDMAKKFSGRVDEKLREAAEFRKTYEPLSGIEGLTDIDPEELSALVEFHQIAGDEDSFKQWLGQAAEAVGWQPEMDEQSWAEIGRENGWIDGDYEGGEDDGEVTMEDLVAKVVEQLGPQLKPMQDFVSQQQQTQGISEAEKELAGQLSEVQQQVGDGWSDELKDELVNLARLYVEEDNPIAKAYEHYQRLTGDAQAGLVDEKLQTQTTALAGGATDTRPEDLSWRNGASPKDAARARFAQT